MPTAVRSRRLGDTSVATVGSSATTTVFTVPAARTAILKDLRAWLSAATTPPIAITFSILLASTASRSILLARAVAAGTPFQFDPSPEDDHWEGWVVLHPGDSLRVAQPPQCTVQTYASGALLDGAPA